MSKIISRLPSFHIGLCQLRLTTSQIVENLILLL